MRRRLLRALVVVVLLAVAAWGWASVDRCGEWTASPPGLVGIGRAAGPLRVGAAVVPFVPRYPVTRAGYGPPRSLADRAALDVAARATVVEVGGQRVALVVLDTLLVTAGLRAAVREATGVTTWLAATHTHSSLGGYDPRLASELAALGSYRADDEAAIVTAVKQAVADATARLAPAQLEVATTETQGLNVARSGRVVERTLTRLRFTGRHGPIAQWIVFSAHPALAPRRGDALEPDWPGRLASAQEANGGPVTLVLQGGGGNASVDRAAASTPEAFATALAARVAALDADGSGEGAQNGSGGASTTDASRGAGATDGSAADAARGSLAATDGSRSAGTTDGSQTGAAAAGARGVDTADASRVDATGGSNTGATGSPRAADASASAESQFSAAPDARPLAPAAALELAWADVAFDLPRPDATRLAPAPFRAAVDNVLCDDAERQALLSALRLGHTTVLLVPVEPSAEAAQVLTEQAGAARVLSLANGYLGYVEPDGVARAGGGESRKQYFDAGFLQRLAEAARLAGQAVAPAR
ncbi:MAG: neutral/alkaline non-lysosomal ceramidase N-terminal domain-containing protein [Myxococcota bacterium]